MCPCDPNDVSFPVPDGPSGPAIPGFGVPFSLPTPTIPFPDGFPEDLLDLLNKLQLLIPPGALKPALNPNFGKDVFDGIMKLLDQFFPFLMLYKFFLPILNLIICIIEVLCALMHPFKLIKALNRLFTQCIPEFLNLFPIFALIIMIISLLLLLLALLLYLIDQILKFILAILRNINALIKAFQSANSSSVLAIAKKLGSLLCIFQNLFVLLSLFAIIIQVIKDILSLLFAIPPCEDTDNSNTDGCCTTDVCPSIVKNQYKNETGTFQYLNEVGYQTTVVLPTGNLNVDLRPESWQIYDNAQTIAQRFINIVDAFDIPPTVVPKPVFFPTDANYSATTNPSQVAYTLDLRMFYNPADWGRTDPSAGIPRFIIFKDCIVVKAPTTNLTIYDNTNTNVPNGVIELVGGAGYEDDGTTRLTGFASDGTTPIADPATLENFLHMAAEFAPNPPLNPTDGHTFSNMEYTFKPNMQVLLQKNLVTLGCEPEIALSRAFINNVAYGDIAIKTFELKSLVFGENGFTFPDPAATQQCLSTALSGLQANLTPAGVAHFQATSLACIAKTQADTEKAINDAIGIGFNPCTSTMAAEPKLQFTTQAIKVTVNINENNGITLTTGVPQSIGDDIAFRIRPMVSFGKITHFTYDGNQSFTADLTSDLPGSGTLSVAFDNQILCTNDFGPPPVHSLQTIDYSFIYSPVGSITPLAPTGEGDTDGAQTRRDAGDTARDAGNGSTDGS